MSCCCYESFFVAHITLSTLKLHTGNSYACLCVVFVCVYAYVLHKTLQNV